MEARIGLYRSKSFSEGGYTVNPPKGITNKDIQFPYEIYKRLIFQPYITSDLEAWTIPSSIDPAEDKSRCRLSNLLLSHSAQIDLSEKRFPEF
jgi:hypothetical protein